MDASTLERIADLICGDDESFSPVYRSGPELTRFFQRAGAGRFRHDGSTRKWWTVNALLACTDPELREVIFRLANPREYGGDGKAVSKAIASLNQVLSLEGLEVFLEGATPKLRRVVVNFTPEAHSDEPELRPLPPPDFNKLRLEPAIAEILRSRWAEADRCVKAEAHLAAIIIMGSLLEGLLLAVLQQKPRQANTSSATPKDPVTGKPKLFHEWSLSEMIDVAHVEKWVDLDVKRFSHALREFRNLIHPYQQMVLRVSPDEDTVKICWLVVQAAVNDLARTLVRAEPVEA